MKDMLNSRGILKNGYGIIPKLVMRDRKLSAEAKAIYAYICSFAGSGSTAFPSIELMSADLNLSKRRLLKYRKELLEHGYIIVHQQRKEGKRTNNIYEIATEIQRSQNDTKEKFLRGQNETLQNETLQFETVQIDTSNNNSINNNSINNNRLMINKETKRIIISKFNEFAKKKIGSLEDKRIKKLEKILKKYKLEGYLEATSRIDKSKWLKENLDFDWFIDLANFKKVLDGNYDNRIEETNKNKKKIANFKQRTDKYTSKELKDIIFKKNKRNIQENNNIQIN
ncbi:helix-turn-helix domain-containing protein [Peptostreptococcaceae bacterium AGR-M142]